MKTIREMIKDALHLYNIATRVKTLQTLEEIEANTENHCLAGAGAVAELNNKLAGQPQFVYGSDGKITGYKTPGGADTVFPFSDVKIKRLYVAHNPLYVNYAGSYTCGEDYKFYLGVSNTDGGHVAFTNGVNLGEGATMQGNGGLTTYMFLQANPGCVISNVSDLWGIL